MPSPNSAPTYTHQAFFRIAIVTLLLVCNQSAADNMLQPLLSPITNLAAKITRTAVGLMQSLPNMLSSPAELFADTKNLVVGMPAKAALRAVNMICTRAMSDNAVRPKSMPNIDAMNFILMTRTQNYTIPFKSALELWHHPHFNTSRPTAVLVTGWTSNINKSNSALTLMYNAYMCRGGINFVAIDTAKFVDTLYAWSALNTEEIGKLLGEALKELTTCYEMAKIHLIGHSLGAHICGAAGRTFNNLTDTLLPRITGLDPANPCFSEGQTLGGLSRGDALFVDVIHSNPGALGKSDPLGDVDFYPNGLDPLPPGCYTNVCAHGRSYEYYAESVYPGNENAFMATRCDSMGALNAGLCKERNDPMGFATTTTRKGSFFLTTNAHSPFGNQSTKPKRVKCNAEDGTKEL